MIDQLNKITLMSFIATILVVVIHVVLQPPEILSFFTRIAVPWFFLVSGFFAGKEYICDGSVLSLMHKRFWTLIMPYLILNSFWFFVYSGLVWLAVKYFGSKEILDFSYCAYFRGLGFDLSCTPQISAFWYVRCLLLFLLLLPVITWFMRKGRSVSLFLVSGVMPLSTLYEYYKCDALPLFGFNMRGLPFFLLGVHFQIWPTNVRRYLGLVVTMFLGVGFWLLNIGNGVPMIALTIAAFWFLLPSLEIPSWMRTVTFPIYVLHQMVLYVLLIPLRFIDFGISSCSINIALLLITIMLSVVIAKLINRYTPRISLIIFGGRV